ALSWDSFRYLSSARALFTSDMGEWYEWIREPVYPLLLRGTIGLLGNSDIWIVAVQATIVVVGVSILCHAWWETRPALRRTALVLIVVNPIVIGFTGWVGQQSVLLGLLCLTGGWLAAVTGPPRMRVSVLIVASATLGAAIVLTSALYLPVVVAAGLYAWLTPRWKYVTVRRQRDDPRSKRTASIAAISLVLAATVSLGSWWVYKAAVIADAENAHGGVLWIWDFDGRDPDEVSSRLVPKILAFLMLGDEEFAVEIPEVAIYGALSEATSDRCGETFDADPPSVAYTAGFIELSCRPAWSTAIHRALGDIGLAGYQFAMLALFLSIVPGLILIPQVRVFAILTIAFLSPYLIGGLGISRYALPLYPFAITVVLIGLDTTTSWAAALLSRPSTPEERGTSRHNADRNPSNTEQAATTVDHDS
ncbi:hypothetical protein ACFLQ7_04125, partial [Actinomycetota bacterium]